MVVGYRMQLIRSDKIDRHDKTGFPVCARAPLAPSTIVPLHEYHSDATVLCGFRVATVQVEFRTFVRIWKNESKEDLTRCPSFFSVGCCGNGGGGGGGSGGVCWKA